MPDIPKRGRSKRDRTQKDAKECKFKCAKERKRGLKITRFANQSAPYRGPLGPSGPKGRKSLENVSQGLRPQNPEKSPKSLRNSPKRLFRHFPETLRRLPRLFPRLFGDFSGFRGRRPWQTFSRLSRHFGPEGRAGSQTRFQIGNSQNMFPGAA